MVFMRLWKLEIIFVSTYSYLNLKIEEHDLFRFIMRVFSNYLIMDILYWIHLQIDLRVKFSK